MTYYVTGYSPEVGRFFRQFLIFFAMHQMAISLFRAIAGFCRSEVVANTVGSMAICIVLVLGGFLIPRPSMPKWWQWAFWISPLSYAETSTTVNEFLAPRWTRKMSSQNTNLGVQILENRGLFHKDYLYWVGFGGLMGFIILINFGYTLALTYLNPIGKSRANISEGKQVRIQDSQEDVVIDPQLEPNTTTSQPAREFKTVGLLFY
jgi:hypothetical protein